MSSLASVLQPAPEGGSTAVTHRHTLAETDARTLYSAPTVPPHISLESFAYAASAFHNPLSNLRIAASSIDP